MNDKLTTLLQLITNRLDAIEVSHNYNLFADGLEIAWVSWQPSLYVMPQRQVKNLPGLAVSAHSVRWHEAVATVLWRSDQLMLLDELGLTQKRKLDIVLGLRTQWEVEVFGVQLSRMHQKLHGSEEEQPEGQQDG